MPEPPDAPLVARFDRKRYELRSYLFVAALVLALIYIWWTGEPRNVVVGMVTFAAILVFLYFEQRRILNCPGPQLIIDADGIVMPDHFTHRLPWEAITSAGVSTAYEGGKILVVNVASAAPYGPLGGTWEYGIRTRNGGDEIVINISHFNVDSTRIQAAIARFAPEKAKPAD